MRQKKIENNDFEIDLGALFFAIWKKAWAVILSAVICASVAFTYVQLFAEKEYVSTTKVIVLFKLEENTSIMTYNDFITSGILVGDYKELIRSRYVMEKVLDELGDELDKYDVDLSVEKLMASTSVNILDNTRVLSITVKTEDPYLAQLLSGKITEIASKRIVDVMKVDAVNIVDEADLHINPTGPDVPKSVMLGMLIGVAIAVFTIIAKFFLDDTITVPDDVDMYLNINVLGVIPNDDGTEKTNKKKRTRKNNKIK